MTGLQKLESAVYKGQRVSYLMADGGHGLLVGCEELFDERAVFRRTCHELL